MDCFNFLLFFSFVQFRSAAFVMQLEMISAFAMPWGLQIPKSNPAGLQIPLN